eukprot:gene3598-1489_t
MSDQLQAEHGGDIEVQMTMSRIKHGGVWYLVEKASGAVYVDKSEGGQRAPSTRTTPITDFPHFIQHDLNIPFAVHTPATVNTFDAAKSDSPSIVVCGLVARGGSDSTGDTAKWNVDHMFVRQRVLSRQGMQASLEAAISDFGSRGEVDQERKKEAAEDAAKAAGKVALRFGVGHRVLANIGKYSAGVVIKLWDQGNPYRIRLDTGTEVWGPKDTNLYVRDEQEPVIKHPLRFKVGDEVLANTAAGRKFEPGRIKEVWDAGHPYRIALYKGSEVWCPKDSDEVIVLKSSDAAAELIKQGVVISDEQITLNKLQKQTKMFAQAEQLSFQSARIFLSLLKKRVNRNAMYAIEDEHDKESAGNDKWVQLMVYGNEELDAGRPVQHIMDYSEQYDRAEAKGGERPLKVSSRVIFEAGSESESASARHGDGKRKLAALPAPETHVVDISALETDGDEDGRLESIVEGLCSPQGSLSVSYSAAEMLRDLKEFIPSNKGQATTAEIMVKFGT